MCVFTCLNGQWESSGTELLTCGTFVRLRLPVRGESEPRLTQNWEQKTDKGRCVKKKVGVHMTFANIVILIPCQGLSLGLHQDYSSGPIITWETEGEAQCHSSTQANQTQCDKPAVAWPIAGQHMVKIAMRWHCQAILAEFCCFNSQLHRTVAQTPANQRIVAFPHKECVDSLRALVTDRVCA